MERARDSQTFRGREAIAHFDAFYEFAFPRVYRFAQRRMQDESKAQALCRLVMVRALTSLGGLGALPHPEHRVPAEFAAWLFGVARSVADQVEADPSLLEGTATATGLSSSSPEPAPSRRPSTARPRPARPSARFR